MKLPLRIGLPLLALLLLGLTVAEGREQLLLIVTAMAVALWSAFSLPHPGPREPAPTLLERGQREGAGAAAEPNNRPGEVAPQDDEFPTNGSGGNRTLN